MNEELEGQLADEADEALEEEAQTPDESEEKNPETDEVEADQEESPEQPEAESTEVEVEAEKPEEKQLSPSQERRRRRREARERQRRELEEAKRREQELKERLAKYEEIDPNTADDYEAAVQQNAVNRALKTRDEMEAEAAALAAQRKQEEIHAQKIQAFAEDARSLSHITDFEEKVFYSSAPFTPDMVEAVLDMERGPEVAYYLATNRDRLVELQALPPMQRAVELGKLEATLPETLKPRMKSAAPRPVRTLKGTGAKPDKPLHEMTEEEYRIARGFGPNP